MRVGVMWGGGASEGGLVHGRRGGGKRARAFVRVKRERLCMHASILCPRGWRECWLVVCGKGPCCCQLGRSAGDSDAQLF